MRNLFIFISLSVAIVIMTYCVGAFYSFFYPMKYSQSIVDYSTRYGIDAGLVASVANVESGFNESAVSNKGAIGIMQLMPSTAQWIASKMGEEYNNSLLLNGDYSLKLGSFYLAYLLRTFNDEKTALCAYNAGPGNVKKWLNEKEYSSDGQKLNKIPFQETKVYLSKVRKNFNYYKNRYKKYGKIALNN